MNSLYDKKYLQDEWHPVIYAWYFKDWVNFDMPFHRHDRVEIMYVIKGCCSVRIEGKELLLKKGELILIDADISHNLIFREDGCRMLNVEFGFENIKRDITTVKSLCQQYSSIKQLFESSKSYIVLKDSDEIFYCLKSLVYELNNSDDKGKFLIQSLMLQLLLKIARLYEKSNYLTANDDYVTKAKGFIYTAYDTPISVADIANHVAVHPVHLERVFKKITRETINQFLTRVRIEKAKMLLAKTDINIIEICDYVGIGSRQYFSYIFKKSEGITPIRYRKIMAAQN